MHWGVSYTAAPSLPLSTSLPTLLPGGIFPKAELEEVWDWVLRPGSAHLAALQGSAHACRPPQELVTRSKYGDGELLALVWLHFSKAVCNL